MALVPSCALMMKFEWPLVLPGDAAVRRLAGATRDASEYLVEIARNEGLDDGMAAVREPITLHVACHARAQNMGAKAAELLRMLPEARVNVVERCSGHGGAWGTRKKTFETGMKVGRPVMRRAAKHHPDGRGHVVSECPLAGLHIRQGIGELDGRDAPPPPSAHPVELIARAYGLADA